MTLKSDQNIAEDVEMSTIVDDGTQNICNWRSPDRPNDTEKGIWITWEIFLSKQIKAEYGKIIEQEGWEEAKPFNYIWSGNLI